MKYLLSLLIASGTRLVAAQQPVWGQCGGIGYTGSTTCVSGTYCSVMNSYYSQCVPGAASTTTTSRTTTTSVRTSTTTSVSRSSTTTSRTTSTTSSRTTTSTRASTTTPASSAVWKYTGVNEAGAEFGENAIPGVLGKDYTWPSPSSIDYFVSNGFNTFRVATKWERICPPSSGMTGPFDSAYISGLDTIINYITNTKGAYAIIDIHNYGRYNGAIVTNTADFKTFWANLANRYKNNARVIFDTNNEYHGMAQTLVVNLNQAAIDGIRSTGATQLILVEGNSWTGAWSWVYTGNGATMINLRDPLNNMAYEMHQYLDADGSGTSPTCVHSSIFYERLQDATNWCLENNVKCFLGEIGSGTGGTCVAALREGFQYMKSSGVWIGFTWWAAGPWWGDYYQSIEPPNGPAIGTIVPILKSYI